MTDLINHTKKIRHFGYYVRFLSCIVFSFALTVCSNVSDIPFLESGNLINILLVFCSLYLAIFAILAILLLSYKNILPEFAAKPLTANHLSKMKFYFKFNFLLLIATVLLSYFSYNFDINLSPSIVLHTQKWFLTFVLLFALYTLNEFATTTFNLLSTIIKSEKIEN